MLAYAKRQRIIKEIHRVNIDDLKEKIANSKSNMAESTVNRRASTIKAWVEWMYSFDREKESLFNF